jgi:PhnB protein
MLINPYLTFDGTCREAFAFYEKVLGARTEAMLTYGDMPADMGCPPDLHDRIAHVRLVVDGQVLMASDSGSGTHEPQQGVSVHLGIDEPAEARRTFAALSEGGTVCMPLGETFWSHAFGVVTDRFGTSWMINCAKPEHVAGAA